MPKFDDINVGDTAEIKHTISKQDIEQFVELTGDDNRLHVDHEYAAMTELKSPVAHGMLGASFISTLIGTKIPGDGALWFSQNLEFLLPVRIGDEITVKAEVVKKIERDKTIELTTNIYNQHKQKVTSGYAKVKIIEKQEKSFAQISQQVPKTALVLGASGGIGRATALLLAEDGFDLALHYHTNKRAVETLKDDIEAMGRKVFLIGADTMTDHGIEEIITQTKRAFDSLRVFVNCTTVRIPAVKFGMLEWDDIQKHIDINVKASFLLLKKIVPIMERQNYGKIIVLTTQAIESVTSEWLHYITAKSALNGFAKALAMELSPKGIRVNMVSPSMTNTDLIADIPVKVKMLVEAKTPLKRLAEPLDVANAILYLASERSDFLSGETIRVNGGQVMV